MGIRVENLTFGYSKDKHVFKNLSFSVESGELTSLIGANGIGKSTLFKCMLGILKVESGSVEVDGEVLDLSMHNEVAKRIAYIPQGITETFGYSAREMALFGRASEIGIFSTPKEEDIRAVNEAFEMLNITHLMERNFLSLSGGEKQLVLIARSLASKAKCILMDEPTSALDFGNSILLFDILKELSEKGYTIIFSNHNPQNALWYSSSVIALCGNSKLVKGPSSEVINDKLIKEMYGVDIEMLSTPETKIIFPKG